MNKRKLFDHWLDVVFFILILVSTMSAVSYISSQEVFDAKIIYVNNIKLPYSVQLEIENKVSEKLKFDIEIIYEKEDLVVSNERIKCENNCELKLDLKNVFFDEYEVVIQTEYNGVYYQKKLEFDLEKLESENQVILKNNYFYDINQTSMFISGKIIVEEESQIFLEAFPKNDDSKKFSYNLTCIDICDFNLNLSSEIILGEYQLNAYFPNDVFAENFFVKLKSNVSKNISENNFNQTVKINLSDEKKDIAVVDLLGDKKIIENVESELELPQGYIVVDSEDKRDNLVKIKPEIESIESLEEIKNLSTKKISKSFGFTHIDDNLTINVSNGFEMQSLNEDFNPVVEIEEKVFVSDKQRYLDVNDESFNISLSHDQRKIVPGVYKKEKILKYQDGTQEVEENIFAYGLISVNTRKPLYHQNEDVEILLVVLDKWGYLVDGANITLNILMPNNESLSLSTQNLDIIETSKKGVYKTYINSDFLGKYKLKAIVELQDMIVDVRSYFNVVENYSFEILRNVPMTIDPWEGPFRNEFEVEPLNNYRGEYDFIEVFSSDFEVIDTDADEVKIENESIYLIWRNLHDKVNLYYEAQVPLKSPYLYFLGNAEVKYNEGYSSFMENRSWLFAIDPAAQTCNFLSPCRCGANCAGGGETGSGTIDTCGDGNVDWEFVNDIRVTSLNGSYFGVGDTVEICVDFDCDTSGSGDRVTIGYSSDTTWSNGVKPAGDVVFDAQCDYNFIRTHCVNQVLDNVVGKHYVRGKIVYDFSRPSNDICDQPTYYDHDDVEFDVLDKVAPNLISWDLNNGTNIGNNLQIIRGRTINISALWDLPLQNGRVRHNGTGIFTFYDVDSYSNNQTNYSFDTSNLIEFPNKGEVRTNLIRAWELYFNLSGDSSGSRDFEIIGEVEINQSSLQPNVGYPGLNTTMKCQIIDKNVFVPYENLIVNFYKNGVLLGTNITNSIGWAEYNFQENILGTYNITCNISSDLSNYIVASNNNEVMRQLFVRTIGADIQPPVISNVNVSPNIFSVGGVTKISADITDDVSVGGVWAYITLPNSTLIIESLTNTFGNKYELDFSKTLIDGNYKFYIYAEDSSGNPTLSSTRNFEVTGVRTFIGIQATKTLYKLGEALDLTPFTKVSTIDGTNYNEVGDSGNILYTFDSDWEGWTHGGTQDEWQRGFNINGFVNQCNVGRCLGTDLDSDYNANSNQWVQTPAIDFTGRSNVEVTFWRMLELREAGDNARFESWDGSSWNILFQDNTVPGSEFNLGAGTSTFYPSEVEGVNGARFRFVLTSDGGTQREGWGVDTFNISFSPRQDWDKDWITLSTGFGSNVNKLTAVKLSFNITSYSSSGSDSSGTASPDIEVQVYNGTDYTGSFSCNLDSTKTYPYNCIIVAKANEYLEAWKTSSNRRIRFRAVDLDNQDQIIWTDVKREYVTPSIIENNGIGVMSAYLLEQFKNSTGGIVSTLYFNPISLSAGESRNLSDFWTYSIAGNFQLGNYSAYVALTDSSGNVLQNEDDNSYINDSYEFQIQSLIINPIRPLWGSVEKESLELALTLDTTSYGAGGWCGFSLNGAANISMIQNTLINYTYNLGNVVDGENEVIFYCNDSDGDMVDTGIIDFNVSQVPRIQFVLPTQADGNTVINPWTLVNVTTNDASNISAYVDINGSLVGYWNFENVSGMNVDDSSIFSHTGILSSGAKTGFVNYIRGKYGDFDGIDDAMVIQNSKNLEGFDEMTIEAWVKPDLVLGNYGYVLAKRDNTEYSFGLAYDTTSGDNWHFYVNDYFTDYIETPMTRGVWTHLVGVYNQTNLSIYVNGNLVAGRSFNEKMISTPNIDIVVGARRNFQDTGIGWPFAGNLDEVKLWDRALSENEIKASFNSKVTQLDTNLTKLKNGVHYYYACAIDVFGNRNCTETRSINISKDLGTLTVTSPTGVSKFSMADIVYFNATTSLSQDLIWILYGNGTIHNLTNIISNDWSYNEMFETGYYNVTFYAKDYLGNILNSSTYLFLVLPDKMVSVEKEIKFISDNTYDINLTFNNNGRWTNHSYLDFKHISFNDYSMSLIPDLVENTFGFVYTGETYFWNVSLAQGSSQNHYYYINGTNYFKLSKNFVIGIE